MRLRRRLYGLSRRYVVGLGVAGSIAAPAVLTNAAVPSASAHGLTASPPIGHVKSFAPAAAAVPAGPSPWTPLSNPPSFIPGSMLLESDGTVLAQAVTEEEGFGTSAWYRLTPNSKGSYIDGTWSEIASMPSGYAPLYYASAILPDGRMIIEGGEYNGEDPEGVWTKLGAIYNPVTNSWRPVAAPPGWSNIGDAESNVLDNGTFMLAQLCQECTSETFKNTTDDALLDARNLTWTVIPGKGKHDFNDEEAWTLEPSGQLLTVDAWEPPATELLSPYSLSWRFAGNTIASPVDPLPVVEIGPQIEMPGGNTLVVGAGTSTDFAPEPCTTETPASTALYDYASRRWLAGPAIPTIGGEQYDSTDGPGSILPDGNALFDVGPCVYGGPIVFYLYNARSNSLSPVANIPNAANDAPYYTRMLALPNGQVLLDDGSDQMEVYTAGGTPNPAWAPSISWVSSTSLFAGQTASLYGSQLAGLDQGAAYGDDFQDNTNYPLVRITNSRSGIVTYARTSYWSSVSVAPGTPSSTEFTIPPRTPAGPSALVVVANGIASQPVAVTIR
jgi:hypothetical protein